MDTLCQYTGVAYSWWLQTFTCCTLLAKLHWLLTVLVRTGECRQRARQEQPMCKRCMAGGVQHLLQLDSRCACRDAALLGTSALIPSSALSVLLGHSVVRERVTPRPV
jgi:hypothetical protein